MTVKLTPAQERLIPFVAQGLPYARIAVALRCSPRTVKNHVYAIADKIGPRDGIPPYRVVQVWVLTNRPGIESAA